MRGWGVVLFSMLLGLSAASAARAAPDFSGVWWVEGESNALRADDAAIPLTERGRAQLARNREALKLMPAREKDLKDISKCTPAGIPRLMLENYPFRIVQTEKLFAIFFERDFVYQIARFTDQRPDYVAPGYAYMGHAIARLDGDGVVLDVAGFNSETMLDGAGLPHGDNLSVVERFTRTGPDSMEVEFTITDPDFYTAPWTAKRSYQLKQDAEIQEYLCGFGVFETRYTRGKGAP